MPSSPDYTRIVKRFRNEILIARMSHERHVLESSAINHAQSASELEAQLYSGIAMALSGVVVAGAVAGGAHVAKAATAGRVVATQRKLSVALKGYEANALGANRVQQVARAYAAARAAQNVAVSSIQVLPKGYAFAAALAGISKFLVEGGDPAGSIGSLIKASYGVQPETAPVVVGLMEVGLAFNQALYRRQLVIGNGSNASNQVAHWSARILQRQLESIYRAYEGSLNRVSGTAFQAVMAD